MLDKIEPFNSYDTERVDALRAWAIGHYENPEEYESVEGKLHLIQTIIDNNWIASDEIWKLQSLGIVFGDALKQQVPELSWVAVDDEYGRDPALQWLNTKSVTFPLTAISKRVEDGVEVDAEYLFRGFQKAIRVAVESEA